MGAAAACGLRRESNQRPPTHTQNTQHPTKKQGRLDILVNNAGEQHVCESLADLSDEQIERTFKTNACGYVYMARAALPHLKEGSSIINCSSVTRVLCFFCCAPERRRRRRSLSVGDYGLPRHKHTLTLTPTLKKQQKNKPKKAPLSASPRSSTTR